MRGRFRSPWFILAVCCTVVVLAAVVAYAYQCNYYSDNAVLYDPQYGEHCGGWGNGCTECWDGQTAESCVEAGFTDCFHRDQQGTL